MSRGGSYGGGKSSLSYLFEPDETTQTATNSTAKLASKSSAKEHEKANEANRTDAPDKPQACLVSQTSNSNGSDCKHQGQNTVYFHNGRPSTKVNSVPGGPSSLGLPLWRQLISNFRISADEAFK